VNDHKETRRYWKLKLEALDCTVPRIRWHWPVVRKTTWRWCRKGHALCRFYASTPLLKWNSSYITGGGFCSPDI